MLGAVQENSFRLVKRKLWSSVLTPNFYGQWLPDRNGTRIEGYFDVAPIVRVSLPLSFGLILALAAIGVVLNVIDLTAGTHFTHDPEVGLVISLCLVPFVVIGYFAVKRLGSRSDESLMEFLERTVAAERVR